MPHFVYDNTNLDFPKIDLSALPVGANAAQYAVAAEWNRLCQAVVDIKSQLRGAKFYGLEAQPSDPNPSGITNYVWLTNTGLLTLHAGVTTLQFVPATRFVIAGDGLDGGGSLSGDVTIDLETLAPSPAGSYNSANITVDEFGRVLTASTGVVTISQRFIYTRSGGSSADFLVDLPIPQIDTDYGVQAQLQGTASPFLIDIPDADKTTTQFRVVTDANVVNGDKIYFIVSALTG